jgi:hypothetical protein
MRRLGDALVAQVNLAEMRMGVLKIELDLTHLICKPGRARCQCGPFTGAALCTAVARQAFVGVGLVHSKRGIVRAISAPLPVIIASSKNTAR